MICLIAGGLAFTACEEPKAEPGTEGVGGDGSLEGTWTKTGVTIKITGKNYEISGNTSDKGTVTYKDGTATFYSTTGNTLTGKYSISGSTGTFSNFASSGPVNASAFDGDYTKS